MTSTPPKRATLNADYQRDWPEYFEAVKGQPPRDTLMRAIAAFELEHTPFTTREGSGPSLSGLEARGHGRVAIDLACGEGRDTREMLRRGWHVCAVDSSTEAITQTLAALTPEWTVRCEVQLMSMEEAPNATGLPKDVDLVNASFALPFCDPDHFPALWSWIARTLRPGGRFAGQFFGDRDDWQSVRPRSHATRAQLLSLLAGYEIEHLDEVEKDGNDAMGGVKHHHVFHVLVRKKR